MALYNFRGGGGLVVVEYRFIGGLEGVVGWWGIWLWMWRLGVLYL